MSHSSSQPAEQGLFLRPALPSSCPVTLHGSSLYCPLGVSTPFGLSSPGIPSLGLALAQIVFLTYCRFWPLTTPSPTTRGFPLLTHHLLGARCTDPSSRGGVEAWYLLATLYTNDNDPPPPPLLPLLTPFLHRIFKF